MVVFHEQVLRIIDVMTGCGLAEADLWRSLDGKTPEGRTYSRLLGMLLLHVPTHAAHHRSELATMLTMTSGSPPDTGINSYYREKSEKGAPK